MKKAELLYQSVVEIDERIRLLHSEEVIEEEGSLLHDIYILVYNNSSYEDV